MNWQEKLHASMLSRAVVCNIVLSGDAVSCCAVLCAMQALFPDNTYSHDSGGDPTVIPELTFEQFQVRHGQRGSRECNPAPAHPPRPLPGPVTRCMALSLPGFLPCPWSGRLQCASLYSQLLSCCCQAQLSVPDSLCRQQHERPPPPPPPSGVTNAQHS